MGNTIVEKHQALKRSTIAIRPYFDPMTDNMGLQKYSMTLFDGVVHEEALACLEVNGQKRYLNGLNEFAPDVKLIIDPQERDAKIRQIRLVVAELEKTLAANIINIDDPEFWNKVRLCRPDNDDLWGKVLIRCGNDPVYLEPDKDPYDLIRLYAIEAGGFSIVAKNLEEARSRSTSVKFFLDKQEDSAAIVTEIKKLKARALSELQKLYDKNQGKLFLVAKILDHNSMRYKKATPNDVLYDTLFEYIEGNRSERDKRKCATRFIDTTALDMETLKIRALLKDATFLKVVHAKADGFIYHLPSTTMMGKNPSDCVEFLKNPLHEDILKAIQAEVEKYWNL